jgi:hypothetical protein
MIACFGRTFTENPRQMLRGRELLPNGRGKPFRAVQCMRPAAPYGVAIQDLGQRRQAEDILGKVIPDGHTFTQSGFCDYSEHLAVAKNASFA